MRDVIFESTLLFDGHLSCPSEYADPRAAYKVIASIPEFDVGDADVEVATAMDSAVDILSADELEYYLRLDEPK